MNFPPLRHFDIWTLQLFDFPTLRLFDILTLQLFDPSTFRLFDFSTLQLGAPPSAPHASGATAGWASSPLAAPSAPTPSASPQSVCCVSTQALSSSSPAPTSSTAPPSSTSNPTSLTPTATPAPVPVSPPKPPNVSRSLCRRPLPALCPPRSFNPWSILSPKTLGPTISMTPTAIMP